MLRRRNSTLLLCSGVLAGGAVLAALSVAFGAVPANFEPDGTFSGSNLNGWHTLGQATWKANAGEITGSGKGWLVFDKSYQDVQLEVSWRCTGECRPGLLLRAEKMPDGGMKGIYVSLAAGDLASYRVTLDAQGKETSRVKLRPNPTDTTVRVAERDRSVLPFQAPLDGSAIVPSAPAGPGRAGGRAAVAPNVPKPNDWNVAEVLLDTNMVRPQLNSGTGIAGGIAEEEYGRYGPFALGIDGGEVKFRNIAYKDIQPRRLPDEILSSQFRMQRLNEYYYSWGPAVADFNRDNVPDIVAGPYIYQGPDYKVSTEIWAAQTLNPSTQYFNGLQYAYDFTGDGWPDVVNMIYTRRIRLFVNPGKEQRRWDAYDVTDVMSGEQGTLRDIDGDGRLDLVFKDSEGALVWVSPDPKNPVGQWIKHPISGPGTWPQHGIGAGDVNGDGRLDVVDAAGWWENPGAAKLSAAWPFHPEAFGKGPRAGGADVAVYDINGDGLNDIMTSLAAHGWGLAWYEQKKAADGAISFVEHMVMNNFSTREANAGGVTFSELHGSNMADMDGDGIPDFVTGKREWSHLDSHLDPDAYGAPVLYVYRTVRDKAAPGGARFVPELVHNRSGIGSHVALVDLNGDRKSEIITSVRRGTFVFWNNWKK